MEFKWLFIAWAIIMVAISADHAYEAKTKTDCRIGFAQSNKTGDEINAICNK